MTVKNNENGANQLPGLTPELVADLEAGRVQVAELNEVQLRQLVEDEDNDEPQIKAPAASKDAQGEVKATPQSPSPTGEPKPNATAQSDSSDDDLGAAYREKANALNSTTQSLTRTQQELENTKRLLEESNKKLETASATKPKKTIDDDGYLESVEERLARLEEENKSLRAENVEVLKGKVKSLDEVTAEARVHKEFLEIETFQYRSKKMGMDLATQRPIREIDKDVSKLESQIGVENVKKMQTDDKFRQEMEGRGVKLPDEWQKWATIMQLHSFKKDKGYPTYTSAFSDFSHDSGAIKKLLQTAQVEAANSTAEKLLQRSSEAALLPAGSGSGGSSHVVNLDQKWTKEKAATWMKANPEPKTEADRKTQYEILSWMETQPDID